MLHSIDSSILFLKEEEVIKAGALDMKMTLAAVEETYKMLGKGQLINPPKIHMPMPKNDLESWTAFHNAMPSYLGGSVNISGVKWASECKKNSTIQGIPYGIDITILSDPETVLPFCILDGTLITAMRTSAVAGVFAKYTAPVDTETVTLVGAGVIGRTMVMAICESLPHIKKIYLADLYIEKAQKIANDFKGLYQAEIISISDSKTAALQSQILVTETTASKPFIDKSWLKPGMTIINMASNEVTLDVISDSDIIAVDYWDQIITNKQKAVGKLYQDGKLTKEQVVLMSDMVLGNWKGRSDPKQIIACQSMGMGALDTMIGYKIYQNAVKMGLGTTVKLWDKPLWE